MEKKNEKLTYQRLAQLHIFSPFTLDVTTEEMKDNKVRVIITAEDTSIFMVHPLEFSVFKAVDLATQQLHQYFRNPMGNGLNIYTGFDWSSDPGWMVSLEYAGNKGRTYLWEHEEFTATEEFNGTTYTQEGFKEELILTQIPANDWRFNYSLGYQENKYEVDNVSREDQRYIIVGAEIEWFKYGQLSLKSNYGEALKDEQSSFERLRFVWDKENESEQQKVFYSFKGG